MHDNLKNSFSSVWARMAGNGDVIWLRLAPASRRTDRLRLADLRLPGLTLHRNPSLQPNRSRLGPDSPMPGLPDLQAAALAGLCRCAWSLAIA